MKIKAKTVALPIDMAEKYNITTDTDGGIIIGQDHDIFQLEKVENVYDEAGSVSIYKLVHKKGYIVAGKGRANSGLPETGSSQNITSLWCRVKATTSTSNYTVLNSRYVQTQGHSLCK